MLFDIASFNFGTLIIDGIFKFDETQVHTEISATNIWVREGKMLAGSA